LSSFDIPRILAMLYVKEVICYYCVCLLQNKHIEWI